MIELGAAPGGWTQVAAKFTKSDSKNTTILAIDRYPLYSQAIPQVEKVEAFCLANRGRLGEREYEGRDKYCRLFFSGGEVGEMSAQIERVGSGSSV